VVIAVLGLIAQVGDVRGAVGGKEFPPGWPWRGITIVFPGGTPGDLEQYRGNLGSNAVRLWLQTRKYAQDQKVSDKEAFEASMKWADTMLDTCSRLGITAVVGINSFPLDPSKPNQTTAAFWENQADQEDMVQTIREVAKHFKGRSVELGAYDFMSEPVLYQGGRTVAPPLWPQLLRKIISAIRKEDENRWIIVAPGPWGLPEGYKKFDPPADQKLVWGVHMYLPHIFTHQGIRDCPLGTTYPGRISSNFWDKDALRAALEPLRRYQVLHPGPVFVGEFSAVRWAKGGEKYICDLVEIFEEYGWGWAYFSVKGWQGWDPDYNSEYGSDKIAKGQFVGEKSARWNTLRTIFGVKKDKP
jgi:hypothetical protein